ncbi:putative pyruvate ferredoxin [Collimonas fungivorans]|uniref:Putative pyruvate ferredoxin n=1 Tax=Collimonas fungivorans TaxID=158899 RepID=A0A127P692_9BURK|nr:putative pyruvate ferredoxin [Collimonas fungivorans]
MVPLSFEAIDRTIELNGAAVALNRRAFTWGRIAAASPQTLQKLDGNARPAAALSETLDELIEHRFQDLIAYQNIAYAERYRALITRVRSAENGLSSTGEELTRAVAINAYRLMAYKDEYEVARLFASPEFKASLSEQFAGLKKISIWLSPPLVSRIDPATGRPQKRKFGPWILPIFNVLARLRGLRGTALDVFGYSTERRHERHLIRDYFSQVDGLCTALTINSVTHAVELASLPQEIRGYGPVKAAAIKNYEQRRAKLLTGLSEKQVTNNVVLSGDTK